MRFNLNRFTRAGNFGVTRNSRGGVAGNINFGDNGYVAFCRVTNDFTGVVLSIKKSFAVFAFNIGCVLITQLIYRILSSLANSAFLRKQGIFFYLYAPALVIAQMPMKNIHFNHGKVVKNLLDFINCPKMTAAIKHKTAP